MKNLISCIKRNNEANKEQPFSVYSSIYQQNLLNVPIVKPLLIVVLNGEKELGKECELICQAGQFVFLSDGPTINMRNIPENNQYFALLIEFDYAELKDLPIVTSRQQQHYIGQTSNELAQCLQQFVECTQWAPKTVWSTRKREIIELLCQTGHKEILALLKRSNIGHRLHELFIAHQFTDLTMTYICSQLAMSESTLRRKLKAEGTSIQAVKDKAKLGLGLHLLQTTRLSIGLIAEKCGYLSQSRFTDRFKNWFGLTPSALRKTLMTD